MCRKLQGNHSLVYTNVQFQLLLYVPCELLSDDALCWTIIALLQLLIITELQHWGHPVKDSLGGVANSYLFSSAPSQPQM